MSVPEPGRTSHQPPALVAGCVWPPLEDVLETPAIAAACWKCFLPVSTSWLGPGPSLRRSAWQVDAAGFVLWRTSCAQLKNALVGALLPTLLPGRMLPFRQGGRAAEGAEGV